MPTASSISSKATGWTLPFASHAISGLWLSLPSLLPKPQPRPFVAPPPFECPGSHLPVYKSEISPCDASRPCNNRLLLNSCTCVCVCSSAVDLAFGVVDERRSATIPFADLLLLPLPALRFMLETYLTVYAGPIKGCRNGHIEKSSSS
jgi:hypothetical protein